MPRKLFGAAFATCEELSVKLVAYPQRPGLPIMQPVIAEQLTALGITKDRIETMK